MIKHQMANLIKFSVEMTRLSLTRIICTLNRKLLRVESADFKWLNKFLPAIINEVKLKRLIYVGRKCTYVVTPEKMDMREKLMQKLVTMSFVGHRSNIV